MQPPPAGLTAPRAERSALVVPGWIARCIALRYWLISVATLAYLPAGYSGTGGDYSFFRTSARVLLGLHTDFGAAGHGRFGIYAADPSTQIGPLSMLVATPVAALSWASGRLVVSILMALALPLILWLSERAARTLAARSDAELGAVVLTAGLFVLPMWHELVLFAHVDDVLVLVCAAAALWAIAERRPVLLGLALGLAVDGKPWALGLLPLILALPATADRLRSAASAGAAIIVLWTGFLLTPGAISGLAGYHILVDASSPLHLLGVTGGAPMPGWARPAQLVLALVLAWVAVWRGQPAAVPLVVVAARVALDAGSFSYYFTGLVVGCAIYEIVGTTRRLAWLTGLVAFVEYDIKWLNSSPAVSAWLNISALVVAAVVLGTPRRATELSG